MVDEIMAHMIDQRKTRRQVLRQLVHLDLIGSAKDLKVRRFVQTALRFSNPVLVYISWSRLFFVALHAVILYSTSCRTWYSDPYGNMFKFQVWVE